MLSALVVICAPLSSVPGHAAPGRFLLGTKISIEFELYTMQSQELLIADLAQLSVNIDELLLLCDRASTNLSVCPEPNASADVQAALEQIISQIQHLQVLPLTCGQCKNFQPLRRDRTRGYCQAKHQYECVDSSLRRLKLERRSLNLACPEVEPDCPF